MNNKTTFQDGTGDLLKRGVVATTGDLDLYALAADDRRRDGPLAFF